MTVCPLYFLILNGLALKFHRERERERYVPLKGVSLGYLGRAFIITLRLGLCHMYLGRPGNHNFARPGPVGRSPSTLSVPGQRSGGNPKPNSDVAQRAIVTRVTPQAAATHGGHVSPLRSSCSLPPRSTSPIQPPKNERNC